MKHVLLGVFALGALALTACSKNSSGNTSSSACTYNVTLGYSTDQNGNLCSNPSNCTNVGGVLVNPQTGQQCNTAGVAGNCIMTAQGYAINQTTGQICPTYAATGGYSSGYGTVGASCNQWTQMYGTYYQLVYYNGQPMCVATGY